MRSERASSRGSRWYRWKRWDGRTCTVSSCARFWQRSGGSGHRTDRWSTSCWCRRRSCEVAGADGGSYGGSSASRTESPPVIAGALAGILHDGCISASKQNLSRFCTVEHTAQDAGGRGCGYTRPVHRICTRVTRSIMSETKRVALVGCGGMGRQHLEVLRGLDGFEAIGVCDVLEENLQRAAGEYGVAACYTDFDEMYSALKPDLVTVATQTRGHCAPSVAALNREISVLCEKPIAIDLA
ncbi:MAG TPA: Gfo/Idh/MocA family oxidoreductase, partial [Candidatus Latescibacteria bacterium]|nr:Gfo/Idh/MocA family oxidoreductase [Candidatus Latescibacterota bacterium]